jgi:hypothetical protein
MPLVIESAGTYTQHKQVKVALHRKGKLTIAKSKSPRLSYSEVISLPLESILSKISGYEADLSDSVVSL